MLRVSHRVLGRRDTSRLFYPYFVSTPLRLSDNDGFMHVNNAVYFSCFDTASVLFMAQECPGEFGVHAPLKPFIAASSCEFLRPMAVPQILSVDTGVSIIKLGRSSCTFKFGLFPAQSDVATAVGSFVHVWTDSSGRPTDIPVAVRSAYQRIFADDSQESG
mmetsp:Transcript_10067/g.25646  ORF Transcript_10067/g.25646 Transcript_10067/m.25646 type:complete len:161 (+) Transcript_10067:566-1048(+)